MFPFFIFLSPFFRFPCSLLVLFHPPLFFVIFYFHILHLTNVLKLQTKIFYLDHASYSSKPSMTCKKFQIQQFYFKNIKFKFNEIPSKIYISLQIFFVFIAYSVIRVYENNSIGSFYMPRIFFVIVLLFYLI